MTESESVALPLGDAAIATHHIIAYPVLFVNTFFRKILFFLEVLILLPHTKKIRKQNY